MYAACVSPNPKRLVQTKLSHPVIFVEFGEGILHLRGRTVLTESLRQFTDAAADSSIIDLALLHAAGIIFY